MMPEATAYALDLIGQGLDTRSAAAHAAMRYGVRQADMISLLRQAEKNAKFAERYGRSR